MNYDHKPSKRLAAGMSGTGKTTLLFSLLQGSPHRWKFVFDPELECARKLGWQAAETLTGLCTLLENKRPVLFAPGKMFPEDRCAALDFFCRFVIAQAARKDGPKLLCIDEIQESTESHWAALPASLKRILNCGRREEIDLLIGAQSINDVNGKIRRQLTELYVFKQPDTDFAALRSLAQMGIGPERVSKLTHASEGRVSWIYRNLLTGEMREVSKAT